MCERDVKAKLLIIDGPCKGQRKAAAGEQFSYEVFSANSKTRAQIVYCLRRHRLLGLVWALPSNKSVTAP